MFEKLKGLRTIICLVIIGIAGIAHTYGWITDSGFGTVLSIFGPAAFGFFKAGVQNTIDKSATTMATATVAAAEINKSSTSAIVQDAVAKQFKKSGIEEAPK